MPGYVSIPKRVLGIFALLAGLTLSSIASASSIYTFNFQQTGLDVASTPAVENGTVSGTFSGTVDSLGIMSLADLTSFHIEIGGFAAPDDWYNATSDLMPRMFGFHVGDPSTLTFIAIVLDSILMPSGHDYCMGAAAGFLCNAGGVRGALVPAHRIGGDRLYIFTPDLVSNSGPTVALVATTPIPASVLLFGTAFGGLTLIAIIRRRRQDPIALAA